VSGKGTVCKQARGPQERVPDGVAHLKQRPGKGQGPPHGRRLGEAFRVPAAGKTVFGARVAWQKGFATVPDRIFKGHVECPDLTSETFNQRGFRAAIFSGFRFGIRANGFSESGGGACEARAGHGLLLFCAAFGAIRQLGKPEPSVLE